MDLRPDVIVMNSSDFKAFLDERRGGPEGLADNVPAVPMHDAKVVTLLITDGLPTGSTAVRQDRKWYKLTKPKTEERADESNAGSGIHSPTSSGDVSPPPKRTNRKTTPPGDAGKEVAPAGSVGGLDEGGTVEEPTLPPTASPSE